jgi:hypothetical protein
LRPRILETYGVAQPGDDSLAGGVVVGDHRALRLAEGSLDLLRVGPEDGDHTAGGLLRGLREKAIPFSHQPEAGLEVEATGGVGGAILPERVPGHHVRTHLEDPALVGVLGGAGEELDLVRDALPDDASDPRQEVVCRLRHPAALSRKYERSHFLANPCQILLMYTPQAAPRCRGVSGISVLPHNRPV